MATIFFRTLFIYALLSLMLRLMGKRQVGELEVSELVTTFLLSEIAALPIDDPDIPLLYAVVPILLLFSIEVMLTFLKTKWNPLKTLLESKPVYLLERGKLNQSALAQTRISVEELLGALREKGYSDVENLYYIILEQNGHLSVFEREQANVQSGISHALVIDGEVKEETLRKLGIGQAKLEQLCAQTGVTADRLFLLQVDDAGKIAYIKKEEDKKQ